MLYNPVELLYLQLLNGREIGKSFPKAWQYAYNTSPVKIANKFFKDKLLIESDYKFNITKARAADIKILLKNSGLKQSGNKEDLIERALTELPEEILKNNFSKPSYLILSESGKNLASKHSYLMYYHEKNLHYKDITLNEFYSLKEKQPEHDKYTLAWEIINKKLTKYMKAGEWNKYRFCLDSLYDIGTDWGKDEKQLLSLLFRSLCYDLSNVYSNDLDLVFTDYSRMPQYYINKIRNVIDIMSLTDTEVRQQFIAATNNNEIYTQILNIENTADELIVALNDYSYFDGEGRPNPKVFKKKFAPTKIKDYKRKYDFKIETKETDIFSIETREEPEQKTLNSKPSNNNKESTYKKLNWWLFKKWWWYILFIPSILLVFAISDFVDFVIVSLINSPWILLFVFLKKPASKKNTVVNNADLNNYKPLKHKYIDRDKKGRSILELVEKYVVVDIETTGLSPNSHEIIEIGAIKVENGNIIESFCELIKPNSYIPQNITKLTGITNQMVENKPKIEEVLPAFYDFIMDLTGLSQILCN